MMNIKDYLKEASWKKVLETELNKDYINDLNKFLDDEYQNKTIFPPKENLFTALNTTSLDKVKVVIIGQDPYHGRGQAHGLCFSVLPPTKIPPSLRNIYKELHADLNIPIPQHGELTKWAQNGVLLLNTILTVEESKPMSHKKRGWEQLTEKIIEILNNDKEHLVFMAWGAPAHSKVQNIDLKKHLVLKSVHPSPLSAHRGFLGCEHFSSCNDYLKSNGIKEVDWSLS